ncbi:glycosyltransferase [Vibrio harveyi]|uniref:glycosyltransferase n=1 Tax=Vibrio harveyi TaxID=669 RepID=UPI00237FAE87|nr:glycosyltransferase [Vibrio harveyi]HDM8070130.1 glycosyltransferase [Vibrio harveyi]
MIKVLKRLFVSIIGEFPINIHRMMFTGSSFKAGLIDRLSFDQFVANSMSRQLKKRDDVGKISAVIRVKNGSEYIEASVLSIAMLATEIVIVDNNSTDETLAIANKLKEQLDGVCEVNIYSYGNKLEIAGTGYLDKVKNNPPGSLADFYNYSFNLAKCEYVMKWDAHAIMLVNGVNSIQKLLKKGPDSITFRGLEFYGKRMDYEMRIYKQELGLTYYDDELFEMIDFKNKPSSSISRSYIKRPAYLHLKRLSYAKFMLFSSVIDEKYK